MNDHDLDVLGRRAAAEVRADAERTADSRGALDRLLADASAPTSSPTTRIEPLRSGVSGQSGGWRRWQVLSAAAAVTLLVVGVALLVRSGAGMIDITGPTGTGSGIGLPTPLSTAPRSSLPPSSPPDTGTGAPTSLPGTSPSSPGPGPTTAPSSMAPPSTSPSDPTAGFTVPDVQPPRLEEVPRLLPQPATPPERTYLAENESEPTDPMLYQMWVRTAPDGRVTALVQLTTRLTPALRSGTTRAVTVPGWETGRAFEMAPGAADVEVGNGTLFVQLRANGLTEAEALAIVGELRADGSTWRAATLAGPDWTPIQEWWSAGTANRNLTSLSDEGDVDTELLIGQGSAFDSAILSFGGELALVDAVGAPGLLRRDGVSGLLVVRDDGLVVQIGSRDPSAGLVSTYTSLTEVDTVTWDAGSKPWPSGVDGCISLFC